MRRLGIYHKLIVFVLFLLLPVLACGSETPPTQTPQMGTATNPNPSVAKPSVEAEEVVPAEETATENVPASDTEDSSHNSNSESPQVEVNLNRVNIRSGPGMQYEVIDTAVQHTIFDIIATNPGGNWFNIELPNGKRGWIGIDVITTKGALSTVDVAVTIPAAPVVEAQSGGEAQPTVAIEPAVAIEPTFTTQPAAVQAVCDCSGDLYNCGSFPSASAALACFNYCAPIAGDIHGLDGDNDGRVCE